MSMITKGGTQERDKAHLGRLSEVQLEPLVGCKSAEFRVFDKQLGRIHLPFEPMSRFLRLCGCTGSYV